MSPVDLSNLSNTVIFEKRWKGIAAAIENAISQGKRRAVVFVPREIVNLATQKISTAYSGCVVSEMAGDENGLPRLEVKW